MSKAGTIIKTAICVALGTTIGLEIRKRYLRKKAKQESAPREPSVAELELERAKNECSPELRDRVRDYQEIRDTHYIATKLRTRNGQVLKKVEAALARVEVEMLLSMQAQRVGTPSAGDN